MIARIAVNIANSGGVSHDFDDFYVTDTLMTLGERRVETLVPTADVDDAGTAGRLELGVEQVARRMGRAGRLAVDHDAVGIEDVREPHEPDRDVPRERVDEVERVGVPRRRGLGDVLTPDRVDRARARDDGVGAPRGRGVLMEEETRTTYPVRVADVVFAAGAEEMEIGRAHV